MTTDSVRILSQEAWLRHPYSVETVDKLRESYKVGTENLIAYCCSSAKTELDIRILGARLQAIKSLLDSLTKSEEPSKSPQPQTTK